MPILNKWTMGMDQGYVGRLLATHEIKKHRRQTPWRDRIKKLELKVRIMNESDGMDMCSE
jgi:hypothetical protein